MNNLSQKNKKKLTVISIILIFTFLLIHISFSERAIFFNYFILPSFLGIYQKQLPYVSLKIFIIKLVWLSMFR